MLQILKQPYPHSDSNKRKLFLSIGAGVFIAIFLIYFQPFGINEFESPDKTLILSGYGIITTSIMLFFYFVVPLAFPKSMKEENWTVGLEIVLFMCNFILIAVCNIFYSKINFFTSAGILDLINMISYTFILGIFPAVAVVLSNYIYHLKQYSHPPQPSNQTSASQNLPITLMAENEKDTLTFFQEDLFYIESNDNYLTVVFQKEEQILKELMRSSLIRLENQIPTESIVRCHRSYIVNLDKVVKVSGNAQGYKFHLKDTDFIIPVARKYSEIVNRFK